MEGHLVKYKVWNNHIITIITVLGIRYNMIMA